MALTCSDAEQLGKRFLLKGSFIFNLLFVQRVLCFLVQAIHCSCVWATTWLNQQNECTPSEDSDQPGHPPSLIRVFAVRSMDSWGPKISSCGQRRLWSDWVDAQADLCLRWGHTHFVGFVMSRLIERVYCTAEFWKESSIFRRFKKDKKKALFRQKSNTIIQSAYEIMALIALLKHNHQTCMRSSPLGLHVWFLVRPFVYFHTLCVRTAKALVRLRIRAVSPEPSLFAYAISTIISWAAAIIAVWRHQYQDLWMPERWYWPPLRVGRYHLSHVHKSWFRCLRTI